jgi:hypothetical protein
MGCTIGVLGFDSWRGLEFFSSSPRQDRLWVPPSLLSNGYQRLFPWGKNGRGVKLTTHLHLLLRSKNEWSYSSTPPIRLHGVMLSQITGTTSPLFVICTVNCVYRQWIFISNYEQNDQQIARNQCFQIVCIATLGLDVHSDFLQLLWRYSFYK